MSTFERDTERPEVSPPRGTTGVRLGTAGVQVLCWAARLRCFRPSVKTAGKHLEKMSKQSQDSEVPIVKGKY